MTIRSDNDTTIKSSSTPRRSAARADFVNVDGMHGGWLPSDSLNFLYYVVNLAQTVRLLNELVTFYSISKTPLVKNQSNSKNNLACIGASGCRNRRKRR